MTEAAKGHLAMLVFAAVVSGSYSLGGMAAPHIDAAALNGVRFAIAAAAMLAICLAGPGLKAEWLLRGTWRYLALGACLALYFVLMFEALKIASPVSTGAVFTLTPAMSAVFGWILLRQVTTPFNAAALALGAAGAIWVIFRGDMEAILGFQVGPGEQLFFFGVAAHAFYTPLVRKLSRGEPIAVFVLGATVAALALILIWGAGAMAATDWGALPAIVWITILYTALAATVGSFFCLQFATLRLPSGKVMAYTYLTPAFVILWEAALGHGWAAPTVWLGAGAAALALALLAWR